MTECQEREFQRAEIKAALEAGVVYSANAERQQEESK